MDLLMVISSWLFMSVGGWIILMLTFRVMCVIFFEVGGEKVQGMLVVSIDHYLTRKKSLLEELVLSGKSVTGLN